MYELKVLTLTFLRPLLSRVGNFFFFLEVVAEATKADLMIAKSADINSQFRTCANT